MKTDELITALAAASEPVDPRAPSRRMLLASLGGAALAVPLMIGLLGLNPLLAQASRAPMFWVKLVFVAAVATAAFRVALQLAKPGVPAQRAVVMVAVPFAAIWLLAVAALVASAPGEGKALILGSTWSACPLNIGMLSAPALVLTLGVMRSLAPIRMPLAGAAAGLLAGALGATVYTLHCPEMAAPFIGTWYVLGMLVPAAVGAALGRLVLRW
jgi:hypothetical protein